MSIVFCSFLEKSSFIYHHQAVALVLVRLIRTDKIDGAKRFSPLQASACLCALLTCKLVGVDAIVEFT
jgi:hypothetical protein